MFHRHLTVVIALVPFIVLSGSISNADVIETDDVVAILQGTVGSGNGTLDLRMMTFSGSEIDNESGSFNGDNGVADLPQGGGQDDDSFAESYVTTAGELQDFYILNFPNGSGGSTVNEIALFIDLNETGGGQPTNILELVDIVLNPTTIQGSPNPSGDVTGAEQTAINQVYTGGTLEANLSASATNMNIPVLAQGAGFADYAVFTGINPFSLNASDVLLFNVSMNTTNNGAEEIFLSGEFSPANVAVPEPTAFYFLALVGVGIAGKLRLAPVSATRSQRLGPILWITSLTPHAVEINDTANELSPIATDASAYGELS